MVDHIDYLAIARDVADEFADADTQAADRDDLEGEAGLAIATALHAVGPDWPLARQAAYLRTAARNRIIDHTRAGQARKRTPPGPLQELNESIRGDGEPDPPAGLIREEERQRARVYLMADSRWRVLKREADAWLAERDR